MITHWLYGALLTAVPIVTSLSVHEFAHARMALALGDPTARNQGRCSLNPLVHLDPLGTLMLFIVGFGWAKPVPVDYRRLSKGSLGRFLVSVAGPGSNILMAAGCAIILRILSLININISQLPTPVVAATFILTHMLLINVALCMFNLIPLFPLDGHHMLRETLPGNEAKYKFMQLQMRYGSWILLAMILLPRLMPGLGINPLGQLFRYTIFPIMRLFLGDKTLEFALGALNAFQGATPFN